MKQCSLDHFSQSLELWLDQNYIRSATIDPRGRVTLTFMDGVKESYEICGCDRAQVMRACKYLSARGVPVRERH